MLRLAESSLLNNPSLTKVVIMEHPPRFDTPNVDPISLKSKLAKLANSTISQLWQMSPLKDKISVGCHSLESSGAGAAHFARYQNNYTGKYDGVHLYGPTGRVDYTNSLKTILMMTFPERNQSRSDTGFGTAQTESHNYCEQTNYQRGQYQPSVQTKNRFSVFNQGNF